MTTIMYSAPQHVLLPLFGVSTTKYSTWRNTLRETRNFRFFGNGQGQVLLKSGFDLITKTMYSSLLLPNDDVDWTPIIDFYNVEDLCIKIVSEKNESEVFTLDVNNTLTIQWQVSRMALSNKLSSRHPELFFISEKNLDEWLPLYQELINFIDENNWSFQRHWSMNKGFLINNDISPKDNIRRIKSFIRTQI